MAQRALARGEIVAVKGLGGYHLACDATSATAVDRLRRRKNRMDKPFAVMVRDIETAERLALIGPGEEALLTSPQRPIVLLRHRKGSEIAESVAPGSPYVGLLLAYAPLHHLLLSPVPGARTTVPSALVMTSGNLSEEPICYDDADALDRLSGIADAWLVHDRPIHVPCDDSVIHSDGRETVPVRRSRGYAPLPVRLPFDAAPMLATGGEFKNTFCIAAGADAWMSQHVGDMGSLETLDAFERSTRQFGQMYDVNPAIVVADAHPGYQVRRWAEERSPAPVELVQHHHAHVAALMVEHGLKADEQVIGCAFDGTGYGSDGAIWGGEILVAGYDNFERAAHLRYVSLPGGDASIRKPFRAALAHLWAAGIDWSGDLPPVQFAIGERAFSSPAPARARCPVCADVEHGKALRRGQLDSRCAPHRLVRGSGGDRARDGGRSPRRGVPRVPLRRQWRTRSTRVRSCVRSIADLSEGVPVGAIAAGFHLAVATHDRGPGRAAAEAHRDRSRRAHRRRLPEPSSAPARTLRARPSRTQGPFSPVSFLPMTAVSPWDR